MPSSTPDCLARSDRNLRASAAVAVVVAAAVRAVVATADGTAAATGERGANWTMWSGSVVSGVGCGSRTTPRSGVEVSGAGLEALRLIRPMLRDTWDGMNGGNGKRSMMRRRLLWEITFRRLVCNLSSWQGNFRSLLVKFTH